MKDAETSAVPDWLMAETRPWWRRPQTWLSLLVIVALGAAVYGWLKPGSQSKLPQYVTQPVVRGNLAMNVSANGTLQPTRTVAIGSELSGTVTKVLVDVNDVVKKGQVLVELDTSKLDAQLTKSRAALLSAQASVTQAEATVNETKRALSRLQEVARLSGGKLPSGVEMDAALAAYERALANQKSAKADVVQAQATLSTDQTNRDKSLIRSPIDGVILTRAVEPGQAVAASLQAVTLFTMAEDLTQLKLSVDIDEADVAQVQVGQTANFSVSAWPSRQYEAKIARVAFASTTTDNVVTYTALLDVSNQDLSLRPGMTAAANITAQERQNVLLVPNTALSFVPASAVKTPSKSKASSGGILNQLIPRSPGRPAGAGGRSATTGEASGKQLWIVREGQAVAIPVKVGLSNGRQTEVEGDAVTEGLQVITEQRATGSGS